MNTTRNGGKAHKLSYALIKKAVYGDREALNEILKIYEPYHNALATYEVLGADGKIHRVIDEDKKILIQMHLVKAIQEKWRELI